ncbi:hypothetical protein ACFL9U_02505 [Thermodesulfobacteriota bacterium]
MTKNDPVELGKVIADEKLQRKTNERITIVDLTGVVVQDIKIVKTVYCAVYS